MCCAVLFVLPAPLASQTTLNPDISVVGDFRAFSHSNDEHADESEELNLADPSMELVAAGYLNPYARADIVVGWHGEESAEIEEVYGTILRGLPLGMNLRVGKYLLEYGRLNPVHEHAWSFIKRPLPHDVIFGEEGLSDMAIRSAFLLPTGDAYTEIMLGLLKGDALIDGHQHHGEEEEEHAGDDTLPDLGFFGRLTTSFATSENAELALGASVLNAVHGFAEHEDADSAAHDHEEDPEQLRSWVIGGDLKYRYKPSRYTSLQIEAELLTRRDEQAHRLDHEYTGAFAYVDYRFYQKYNAGAIWDWSLVKEPLPASGVRQVEVDTWRIGLFTGFAPVEETSLVRLAGHYTNQDEGDDFWEFTLQFVFSLGPHQPHSF
jgi:hypothetical protein